MLSLDIKWNHGHDVALTEIKSSNEVLTSFFTLQNWREIHDMSKAVAMHQSFYGETSSFSFVKKDAALFVDVYTDEGSIRIDERFFIEKSLYLFELLIAGANEHHHTIRYETWWHAFTDYMFAVQEQIIS